MVGIGKSTCTRGSPDRKCCIKAAGSAFSSASLLNEMPAADVTETRNAGGLLAALGDTVKNTAGTPKCRVIAYNFVVMPLPWVGANGWFLCTMAVTA